MKTIKIIDSLYLDEEGVKAKSKNGRLQTVHLQQGDLDGACSVYSTMMILILVGAVKYNDIRVSTNNNDKRSRIGRLKKELLETNGLHRDGVHFSGKEYYNIKNVLSRNFSKLVTADYYNHDKYNVVDKIKEIIENNQPVLISIVFKGGDAHALAAIGIECDENDSPTKILCLDPAYPTPKFTYWNSVIELNKQKGIYNHRNIAETGKPHNIQLQDILVISKR